MWLSLTPHEWAWPPAVAALSSVDGNPHRGQTQAAPRIQSGARKATCSENKLLTVPKAQAMAVCLACRKTCWDDTNTNIWKRNMGLGQPQITDDWRISLHVTFLTTHLKHSLTQPKSKTNTHHTTWIFEAKGEKKAKYSEIINKCLQKVNFSAGIRHRSQMSH